MPQRLRSALNKEDPKEKKEEVKPSAPPEDPKEKKEEVKPAAPLAKPPINKEKKQKRPGARMLHPLNGRVDFAHHTGETAAHLGEVVVRLTPALISAMLRRENDLRLSDEIQREYGKSDDFETFSQITEGVQRRVAGEFGFETDESVAAALDAMRGCEALWPERAAEFRALSHYRKFNRARAGELCKGDTVPEALLDSIRGDGDEPDPSLADVLGASARAGLPTLLVAGSYS
jgi:hypothetical protein